MRSEPNGSCTSYGKPVLHIDKELKELLRSAALLSISKGDACLDENEMYYSESHLFHFFVNMALCNTVVVNAQPHQVYNFNFQAF